MPLDGGFDENTHTVNKSTFFAAKVVVDDGGKNKGDRVHWIGGILSAKFIVKAICAGVADMEGRLTQ